MLDALLALALVLAPAFADPRQQLEAHARAAVERMAPCRQTEQGPRAACLRDHRAIAHAIALVAETEADAVALIGISAHESGIRDVDQVKGNAWGPWQLETARELRAGNRADLLWQARYALAAWRHGASVYACGQTRKTAPPLCFRAARELEASVTSAWWAWAATR